MSNQKPKLPPIATANMYKAVSDYRKETLTQEVEQGLYRDGATGLSSKNAITQLGNVESLVKKGQLVSGSGGGGGSWRGGNDTSRMAPDIYHPLWLTSNLNLPRDRASINAWCRAFFALNGIVQTSIRLHSTYPISKLNIKCSNPKVEQHFSEMAEEIDLLNACVQIAQEFYLLGEAFPYLELDESRGKWDSIKILNPDYVVVKKSGFSKDPSMFLIPDNNLKKIVNSTKAADVQLRQQMDSETVSRIKRGDNIPVDSLNISQIANFLSPYDVRGTGLPVSVFRQLMLIDMYRECKYVQAQSLVNPIRIIKIGSQDYRPTPADLQSWRNIFEEAEYDKNFKIFTHEAVAVETIGAGSGILDTSNDIVQLWKEVYAGLMVPSVVIEGGGDITYANAGVTLDVLRQRYMQFRNYMANWLKRKVFAPISKHCEFYTYQGKEKKLIIPEVEWNHMSLFDAGDYVNNIMQLVDKEKASEQTIYRSLGLEYEDEVRKRRKESITKAIEAKEKEALQKLTLTELRSLGDNDEIPEPVDSPVPGESPYSEGGGAPADTGGGGGGGLGGGSPPPPPPPIDLGGGGPPPLP